MKTAACIFVLFLFAHCLAGCAGSLDGPYYVDSDFSPAEEEQIQQAADAWHVATNGAVHFDLVFGVPLDPTYGAAWGRRIIARVNDDELLTPEVFAIQQGAIGDTIESAKLVLITVVPTRLGPNTLREVVAHEFGHAVGMHHVADGSSLLATLPTPDADNYVTGQCLSHADEDELRRNVDLGRARVLLCP